MSKKIVFSSIAAEQALTGTVRVPGDKSISHRAVMFSSLAEGRSVITGFLEGEDVLATLAAFQAMGVNTVGPENGRLEIEGVGMRGLQEPQGDLDMGNAGTAMRLLSGLLAAQKFPSKLIGDESLSKRPMRRVTVPLTSMGAKCVADENGCPPIHIRATEKLEPINYKLPMASAQIKSAVLLAGMYAEGTTSVTEPAPTRDHTERMLRAFGYPCESEDLSGGVSKISITGGGKLVATDIDVPADISSAAFFMVAAAIVPGSDITLEHVGINPTRTGVINILKMMGANIECFNQRDVGGEPVADIRIWHAGHDDAGSEKSSGGLVGTDIDPAYVPLAIDEFPVLCIAAACAKGQTTVTGAEELRHKESDRITAMATGLKAIGIDVVELKDGLTITGGEITGGAVDSYHDHRIAMAFAIAGSVATGPITINRCENVATSFPNFVELANHLGMSISESA